jgi:hypothetical protein
MTLANPKPKTHAYGKTKIICVNCGKEFYPDGRGTTPKYCRPCRWTYYKRIKVQEATRKRYLNQFFNAANWEASNIIHILFSKEIVGGESRV